MKRVLVVDNNPVVLRLISSLLAKNGHEVRTAETGLSTLELLKAYTPEVVFLDLVLPDIGGDKLCRIMRQRPELKNAQIVIITGMAAEGAVHFSELGADACIAKGPFKKMSRHILDLIEKPRREQADTAQEILGLEDMYARGIVRELNSVKRHMEVLISSISDGILEITSEGVILYANPSAVAITGWLESRLISTEIWKLLEESERASVMDFIRNPGKSNGLSCEDNLFHLRNGREVCLSIHPIRDDENKKIVVINDVTEQKKSREALHNAYLDLESRIGERTTELARANESLNSELHKRKRIEAALRRSEERYRLLFENADECIFVIQDGVVKFPNPRGLELIGYSAEEFEALDGLAFNDHVHPEDRPAVASYFEKWRKGESPVSRVSFRIFDRSEKELWVKVSGVPLEWESRDAVLIFMRDITMEKKMESQLLQAQKMEAIGTLAGGLAHDFNNILMGIQGYTSLMLFDLEPDHPHTQKLKGIQGQVKSGAGLAKQMLGFARGGKYEVKPTDLREILDKTADMFGRSKKEIRIYKKYADDLWVAEIDQGQIEQVLINLYVNAWHAMPSGGDICLELQNTVLDRHYASVFRVKPGDYVKISVTDTGTGMDPKTRERIFEPFFTTKEMGRGTGLGLAMAYGIVTGHGGAINVYSERGQGSKFNIYLPASRKDPGRDIEVKSDCLKGTETILVVDDEKVVVDVKKDFLAAMGYHVLTATNGMDALKIYRERKHEIGLVIFDMIMPEMGGGELFAALKEMNPGVKAILSSGYSLNGQAQQIMDNGCRSFIQKPFDMPDISRKIREVLDAR